MECVPLYDALVAAEKAFDQAASAAQLAGRGLKRQTSFWDGSTFVTAVGFVALFTGPIGMVIGGLTIGGSELDRFQDIDGSLDAYLAADEAQDEAALDYAEAWQRLCECGAREYQNR